METRSRARDAQTLDPAGVAPETPVPRSAMDRSPEEEDLGLCTLMCDRVGSAVGGGRPEVRVGARHQRDDPGAVEKETPGLQPSVEPLEQGWVLAREPVSPRSFDVGGDP